MKKKYIFQSLQVVWSLDLKKLQVLSHDQLSVSIFIDLLKINYYYFHNVPSLFDNEFIKFTSITILVVLIKDIVQLVILIRIHFFYLMKFNFDFKGFFKIKNYLI